MQPAPVAQGHLLCDAGGPQETRADHVGYTPDARFVHDGDDVIGHLLGGVGTFGLGASAHAAIVEREDLAGWGSTREPGGLQPCANSRRAHMIRNDRATRRATTRESRNTELLTSVCACDRQLGPRLYSTPGPVWLNAGFLRAAREARSRG